MQYRRLGDSGLQVSALSLCAGDTVGGWTARGTARDIVAAAWDHGINLFDGAGGHANGAAESLMGDVIADLRLPRDGFAVSSRVSSTDAPRPIQQGLSRKRVHDACHAALGRLRVDYLDLFSCQDDSDAPVPEIVGAMDALIRQGKILYWGTAEWPAARIREAHAVARTRGMQPPTMECTQYDLLHRERVELEYAPLYAECGLGTIASAPFASALLDGQDAGGSDAGTRTRREAGLRRRDIGEAANDRPGRAMRLAAIAGGLGLAPAPLAIAWCLRNPHVSSVLLAARRVDQLLEQLGALALGDRIDAADWARIEAATG